MTAKKIAITVPEKVLAKARLQVKRGAAPSLSAYFSRAADQQAREDDLKDLIDETLARTGGPTTPEERRWAREVLGVGNKARKKR